jgi:hypothetical protein
LKFWVWSLKLTIQEELPLMRLGRFQLLLCPICQRDVLLAPSKKRKISNRTAASLSLGTKIHYDYGGRNDGDHTTY